MKEFDQMREELEREDEEREKLILQSRKLLILAKKAMYNTHRGEHDQAQQVLGSAEPLVQDLLSATQQVGATAAALQEWCESKAYYVYATEHRLLTREESGLNTEEYLLAIMDLTGELARKAVLAKIEGRGQEVKDIRTFVDDLLGEFLNFNFRNGELRKKTDQTRWNLQKIEELLIKQ